MAFLRRSLGVLGYVNRLQKIPNFSLLKMPMPPSMHTMESSHSRLHKTVIPALVYELQNSNCLPLFSISQTVINSQILPSLPRGRNTILDLPALPMKSDLEMPTAKAHLNNAHIMPEKVKMEDPQTSVRIEKHAVRMIVIRRRKMKNHQRRKAYKKNRVVYARIRHARKTLKEKNLQTRLLAQLNEARSFSPQKYAFDLLSTAYEKVELPPRHEKKKPWEF